MEEKLVIDYEEMEESIEQMRQAHEEFSKITQLAFFDEINYLEVMNADFVETLIQVLQIARGWNLNRIKKNVNEYIGAADMIYQIIKEQEEALIQS